MSLCFSVHLDELLVVIDNVVLYWIYPHCLDCFHGCCLCSCDARRYKGQGRSMLLLFFSRKTMTHMWYRMLASLECASLPVSAIPARTLLPHLGVSTWSMTYNRSTASRASVSLLATDARYTSEISLETLSMANVTKELWLHRSYWKGAYYL